MRRSTRLLPIGVLLASTATAPALAMPSGTAFPVGEHAGVRSVPGRLVVLLKPGVDAREARALHAELGTGVLERAPGIDVDVVRVPAGASIDAAIRRYERDPRVISAEPDRIALPMLVPTDPDFDEQWALRNTGQLHDLSDQVGPPPPSPTRGSGTAGADVDAVTAWDTTTGSATGPVVAVIDDGVDIDHPDLEDSLWINPGETPGNNIDDDGNGLPDDVNGWDFKDDDKDPSPGPANLENSHGTHVAGIVAAGQNDGVGISGVCPGCRIMALRFNYDLATELEAIDYAIANGADIINMSFGSAVWSGAERAAIQEAGEAGILTVVAAGNSSLDNEIPFYPSPRDFAPSFPASYSLPTILTVAASNHRDQYGWFSECTAAGIPRWRCAFTSWGHEAVDVAAPGVDIRSTVAVDAGRGDADHDVFDGTSMAAPLVAGIAGLVLDVHPTYTPVDLKNAIMNSVDVPPSLQMWSSWQDLTGIGRGPLSGRFSRMQGRVNASAALTAPTTEATAVTDGNVAGARPIQNALRGRVAWPGDVNDVYRRRLRDGIRYAIKLDGPRRADMDLWVFNPGTKEIWQLTFGCLSGRSCPALRTVSGSTDADERVEFRARRTGIHYIVVTGWYSGGRYRLSVRNA